MTIQQISNELNFPSQTFSVNILNIKSDYHPKNIERADSPCKTFIFKEMFFLT